MTRLCFCLYLMIVCVVLCASCTDENASRSALTKQGFTDIKIEGVAWWACGEGDSYATKFTAKNSNGMQVSGAVCCGVVKSCTIRW